MTIVDIFNVNVYSSLKSNLVSITFPMFLLLFKKFEYVFVSVHICVDVCMHL